MRYIGWGRKRGRDGGKASIRIDPIENSTKTHMLAGWIILRKSNYIEIVSIRHKHTHTHSVDNKTSTKSNKHRTQLPYQLSWYSMGQSGCIFIIIHISEIACKKHCHFSDGFFPLRSFADIENRNESHKHKKTSNTNIMLSNAFISRIFSVCIRFSICREHGQLKNNQHKHTPSCIPVSCNVNEWSIFIFWISWFTCNIFQCRSLSQLVAGNGAHSGHCHMSCR